MGCLNTGKVVRGESRRQASSAGRGEKESLQGEPYEIVTLGPEIEVEIRGSAGSEANQKLFERAITNLLLNARAYGGRASSWKSGNS